MRQEDLPVLGWRYRELYATKSTLIMLACKDVAGTFQAATVDNSRRRHHRARLGGRPGVGAVELPKEYPDLLTAPQIAAYDAALAAGRAVSIVVSFSPTADS